MEEVLTAPNEHPSPDPGRWETLGLLRSALLRLDGQLAAIVKAETHVVDPVAVSDELARQLKRIAQQMGLGAGDGAAKESGKVRGFEPVKPGFTREAGSFRRQVPPHGVRDVGE
jgi:hypothetical protein